MSGRSLILALCALIAAGTAASATDWPQPEIPLVYREPGYVSPNDGSSFAGRDYDLAEKNEAELAVQALSALADARRVVGSWHQSLLQAETAFWGHYARTGQVDTALRNEFAYWIEKRREWTTAFGFMSIDMSLKGNNAIANILEFQFGANDEDFFGLPHDWKASTDGPVATAPGLTPGDTDYPVGMGEWSRYSYMTACPCSPKHSDNAIDRIGFMLAHPSGNVKTAGSYVTRLRAAARAGDIAPSQLERYLTLAMSDYGFVLSSPRVLDAVLGGEPDPVPAMVEDAFMRYSGDSREAMALLDQARVSAARDRIEAGAMVWAAGRPVLLNGQSVDSVQACVADNWDIARAYVFETNPDRAVALVGIPSMETVKFRQGLGYVAAIACTSPDGLADLRIEDFLVHHGFY